MKRTIKLAVVIGGVFKGMEQPKCWPYKCGKCKLCCRSPIPVNRSKGNHWVN